MLIKVHGSALENSPFCALRHRHWSRLVSQGAWDAGPRLWAKGHAMPTMPPGERGSEPWVPGSKHWSAPCEMQRVLVGAPAAALGRQRLGRQGWECLSGSPGGAHNMLVSFSFFEDLSLMDDILVEFLWLGSGYWPVSSLRALARREKKFTLNFLKS